MFFNASGPSNFLTIGFLHLGVEMDDNNITINCLIVPIGKLMNIPCIKVMQSITIRRGGRYSDLETAIQSRLGATFNKISLKICIIRAGSVIEMEMDMYEDFIDIFTEEPKAEHFHFTVYPNNFLYYVAIYSQFLCNVGRLPATFFIS